MGKSTVGEAPTTPVIGLSPSLSFLAFSLLPASASASASADYVLPLQHLRAQRREVGCGLLRGAMDLYLFLAPNSTQGSVRYYYAVQC